MTTEIAVVQPSFLRPVIEPGALIDYHKEMVSFIHKGLEEGVDYGTIPGTQKPTLLKPGAERLCKAFNLTPKFEIVSREADHDRKVNYSSKYKADQESVGVYAYVVKCLLTTRDGMEVAEGVGSCSTMEAKYISRPRDMDNTVLKMAKKRALVDATLTALGLSNRFTQDAEDMPEPSKTEPPGGSTYSGTTEQQEKMKSALLARNVPEDHWAAISDKMMGKFAKDLPAVIKEVCGK